MLRRSIAGLVFALTSFATPRPRADLYAVRRRIDTGPVLHSHPVDVQPRRHAWLHDEAAYCPAQFVRRDQMAAFMNRLGNVVFAQGGSAFGGDCGARYRRRSAAAHPRKWPIGDALRTGRSSRT